MNNGNIVNSEFILYSPSNALKQISYYALSVPDRNWGCLRFEGEEF